MDPITRLNMERTHYTGMFLGFLGPQDHLHRRLPGQAGARHRGQHRDRRGGRDRNRVRAGMRIKNAIYKRTDDTWEIYIFKI